MTWTSGAHGLPPAHFGFVFSVKIRPAGVQLTRSRDLNSG